ncbi:MAG: hypothetical protein E6Q97_37895 [Desulfurellales bacterium]|nr:MAG: hypothetical protein E6Q97_37895 [Desulfurellales bacterium]
MKRRRWFESYLKCGCVSDFADRKKDLLGYCPTHGTDREHAWPVRIAAGDVAPPGVDNTQVTENKHIDVGKCREKAGSHRRASTIRPQIDESPEEIEREVGR